MTDASPTILIIDDEPAILELLNILVTSEGYETIQATNGNEALALLDQHKVDAIISDVHMPEMNGYHLILKIRENPATQNIPFIFVSSLTSLEEMLQGYELGADEYIKKPIDPNEVLIKLNYIIESKLKHTDLNNQATESQKAAMQAMSYSSYLGQVLQFMQNSLECNDFQSLANEAFNVLQMLGLESSLQFQTHEGVNTYIPGGGQASPLEINIIELARKKGRFFDFENRTLINHDEFSLLLKNMPIEDPERYGLYKDILGNLCTAIEARVKFILSQKIAEKRNEVMLSVDEIVTDVDKMFSAIQEESLAAIQTMTDDIEESFLSLGLTETQEDSIRGIVKKCAKKTDAAFEEGYSLTSKLKTVHDNLNKNIK